MSLTPVTFGAVAVGDRVKESVYPYHVWKVTQKTAHGVTMVRQTLPPRLARMFTAEAFDVSCFSPVILG